MPFDPQAYDILLNTLIWLAIFGGTMLLVLILALLIGLAVRGTEGVKSVLALVRDAIREVAGLSWRRTFALATLTFKEAVRRKTLLVFVVFAVLFMFAGWFLQGSSSERGVELKQHVSFALRTISWLMLPVALLLACWGIPEDIKARSLHTVVTKPVRRSEVVLGRMVGFIGVGSVVVLVMGFVGYFWVVRQLPERAKDQLTCRVPAYGKLSFIDRQGNSVEKGVNVGDMWQFRSFIEGATKSRAVWDFSGLDVEELKRADKLVLETNFEAFRTHKGDIRETVLCKFDLINPDKPSVSAALPSFHLNEFNVTEVTVPSVIRVFDQDKQVERDVSLFDELISDGKLRVAAQCVDAGQYIGMARPDLFVKMENRPFVVGYAKSILSIWLMMVLVVVVGVTASTFLKGPVATLATFALIIMGLWFRPFMETLAYGQFTGGGPIESSIRMWTHMNVQERLDQNVITQAATLVDYVAQGALFVALHLIPNFEHFTRASQYLPNGFDVDWRAGMLPVIFVTLAYIVPCLLIGFYSLRLRELESK
jgi:hypothetical protein